VGLDEIAAAERFFARWGNMAVLVGRLLPVIRTFIAFPAGVARMPLIPFHIYTFVGSWPFCFALAGIGRELGERWNSDPRLKAAFHQADLLIGLLLVAAVAFYIWHRVNGIKKNRAILAEPDPLEPRQP
jgi:membrane protein DedA with SNARE-associated domain